MTMVSNIQVILAPEFRGAAVALASMDKSGAETFRSALILAARDGRAAFRNSGTEHEIVVLDGVAEDELRRRQVIWKFELPKISEIIDKLGFLHDSDQPGHHYVDIVRPEDTLVLSRDEYQLTGD
ncbi:hypothetical protein ACFYTQ_35365 [Nocardia sp. NPDC004068]|uniref:hypothetical protein n=1 Tax=Nocardia sp. NPDC004068 TaxID=3364303 RepID=UPI003673F3C4